MDPNDMNTPEFWKKLDAYQNEITQKITSAINPFGSLDVPFIIIALKMTEKELRKAFPQEAALADKLASSSKVTALMFSAPPEGEGYTS